MNELIDILFLFLKDSKIKYSITMEAKWLSASELGDKYPTLITINLWIHGLLFRLLPCILLLILSILLIYVINIANNQKQKAHKQEQQQHSEFNKTTIMLLLIILLFLIMEFPHGKFLLKYWKNRVMTALQKHSVKVKASNSIKLFPKTVILMLMNRTKIK